MATRDYNTFYSTLGLWEIADPTHNDLQGTAGPNNGNNADTTLTEVLEWNAVSPAVVAIVTAQEPELIQYVHPPRKFRGGGPLHEAMVWAIGNTEDDAHFSVLPNNMFARANNILVRDDSAAIVTALGAPGVTHDVRRNSKYQGCTYPQGKFAAICLGMSSSPRQSTHLRAAPCHQRHPTQHRLVVTAVVPAAGGAGKCYL